MKRILLFIGIASLIALTACEKVIPLNAKYQDPRLVVNAFLKQDSVIRVSLTCSRIIIDNANVKHVPGATVKLYKNGEFLEDLTESGQMYVSNYRAEPGAEYSIKASADGYDEVNSKTTVPFSVPVISLDTMSGIDEYGSGTLDFSLKFALNADQKQYFLLRCLTIYPQQDPEEEEDDYHYYYYYPEYRYIETNDIIVEGYDQNGVLFSDRLIQTDTYTFNGSIYSYAYDTVWLRFEFFSLNQDMYDYFITRGMHYDAQGNPLMEPVIVYSNVSSGMGIMGGGAVYTDSIMLKPDNGGFYY